MEIVGMTVNNNLFLNYNKIIRSMDVQNLQTFKLLISYFPLQIRLQFNPKAIHRYSHLIPNIHLHFFYFFELRD